MDLLVILYNGFSGVVRVYKNHHIRFISYSINSCGLLICFALISSSIGMFYKSIPKKIKTDSLMDFY